MSEQISQEADFDPADINPVIPDDVNIEIAKLVFNWAKFDALITNLLFQLMLIPSDLGQIRIRRMGITDKQSRTIEIYGHFGDQNHKAEQTQILKMIDKWYPVRNVICHSECLGMSIKAHPGSLVIITSNLMKMCRARGWWYIIQYKRSKMLLGLLPFRPMQYRG